MYARISRLTRPEAIISGSLAIFSKRIGLALFHKRKSEYKHFRIKSHIDYIILDSKVKRIMDPCIIIHNKNALYLPYFPITRSGSPPAEISPWRL